MLANTSVELAGEICLFPKDFVPLLRLASTPFFNLELTCCTGQAQRVQHRELPKMRCELNGQVLIIMDFCRG